MIIHERIQLFIDSNRNGFYRNFILHTSAGDNVAVLFGVSAVPPVVVVFPELVKAFVVLPVDATSSIQETASSSP